jgi:hypothetical protein
MSVSQASLRDFARRLVHLPRARTNKQVLTRTLIQTSKCALHSIVPRRELRTNLQAQALVEASIRHTIGTTYIDLGLYPEVERQLDRASCTKNRELTEKSIRAHAK